MSDRDLTGYCKLAKGHPFHGPYHDLEYGFPVKDDNVLFERLVLEINQAGLSWIIILKKRKAFQDAFSDFNISRVASYGDADCARLLSNRGIIRNKRKVDAVIRNANHLIKIKKEFGSFYNWLIEQSPRDKDSWVKLFEKNFTFTGGEITGEFLMSTGFLPGAHASNCPVLKEIARLNPPYMWRK